MTLEELQKEANKLGYKLTPQYECQARFVPCICGHNRRSHSYDTATGMHIIRCKKCRRNAIGITDSQAKVNWNTIMRILQQEYNDTTRS